MIKKLLYLYFIEIVLCYNLQMKMISGINNYFTTNSYLNNLNHHKTDIRYKIVNYDDIIISLCNNNIEKILLPTTNNLMVITYKNNNTKYFYDTNDIPNIINNIKKINNKKNYIKIINLPDYFNYFYHINNFLSSFV